MDSFFEESMNVREEIRKGMDAMVEEIPHPKLKDIIRQRNKTSSFLKGSIGYFLHEGVGGTFPHEKRIELATGIEVLCSSGAIFDNAIDGHEERNGETTFLKEHGIWMQVAASQYVLHHGFKMLFPFMETYVQKFPHMYSVDDAVVGMVGMDIETSSSLDEQVRITEKSNGRFAEVPLVIAATTGTDDSAKIGYISQYGFSLGTALGIYEEVRDIAGVHGRRRATEVESGRFAIPLHYANQASGFNAVQYVGKEIDDESYEVMMEGLVRSKSLRQSQRLVQGYFERAEDALRLAVNQRCFEILNGLPASASLELEKIIQVVEEKHG